VGEQIGDVLLPSFAHMTEEQRRSALPRAMGILGLVVFPLAVGLGAVAHTVVAALLDPKWQAVAPMLVILSMLSVTRPVGWVVASYLQAQRRTRAIMILEVTKALGLVVFLLSMGRFGPLWACAAAGATYGAHAIGSAWVVRRLEGVAIGGLLAPLLGPLLACVPMVAAVLGTRLLLSAQGVGPKVTLPCEVLAGGVAYVAAALLIAPGLTREMISLIRRALSRRKRPPAPAT
jgi:PST family polysaccharide transporter